MGDRLNETDMASDVLVFMVVGLQGYWKAPIAYYLTLTPQSHSLSKACIRRAASSADKSGVHDNGWPWIQCQYAHSTWVRSESRALEDPFPTSSNP